MYCISISFKKTPLDIREKFAFQNKEQILFLSSLKNENIIKGGVLVSTCNRSELYFTESKNGFEQIEKSLSEAKNIPGEIIKKYCLYYEGKKAIKHLYRVACGLDSMVLGEDEILRQVKEAYLLAENEGLTDSELNIIFQGAFNCAKLSKSETELSNTPVSFGTLTARFTESFLLENRELPQGVLVIGATGKIGSIVAKDLNDRGIRVIGTSRRKNPENAFDCGRQEQIEWIPFTSRYEILKEVSVVISATTSPHYTLTGEAFNLSKSKHNYLLIDLAVPFDIDKELANTAGIRLVDIDYFKTLSKENTDIKMDEAKKAAVIADECAEEVLKKLYIRSFQKKLEGKHEEAWFDRMLYYLRDVLDSEQLLAVLEKICKEEGCE